MRGDLAEANLPALFPGMSPEQLDRVQHVISRLQPAVWDWLHAEPSIDLQFALVGAVCLGEDADDQVELELCVGRRSPTGETVVSATVGVYCWCPQDHCLHYVHDIETTTTSAEELMAAIEAATDQLVRWRETSPHDAEWWRAEAGLPLRRG